MHLTKKAKIILLILCVAFAGSYFYVNRADFLPKPKAIAHIGIVSLSPSATEILAALNAQDVMGVSNDSEYPEKTRRIKRMGTNLSPDVNEIITAVPEVMFVDPSAPAAATEAVSKSGVRVIIVPKPQRVEDIYFNINFIASNIGKNSSELTKELKTLAGAREFPKTKVFIALDNSLKTIGYLNFVNDVLAYAGLRNIFGNIGEDTMQVSWESVAALNPDIIISIGANAIDFSAFPNAENVNAVKNHKVYSLTDIAVLSSPSPRTLKTIAYLKGLASDIEKQNSLPS